MCSQILSYYCYSLLVNLCVTVLEATKSCESKTHTGQQSVCTIDFVVLLHQGTEFLEEFSYLVSLNCRLTKKVTKRKVFPFIWFFLFQRFFLELLAYLPLRRFIIAAKFQFNKFSNFWGINVTSREIFSTPAIFSVEQIFWKSSHVFLLGYLYSWKISVIRISHISFWGIVLQARWVVWWCVLCCTGTLRSQPFFFF